MDPFKQSLDKIDQHFRTTSPEERDAIWATVLERVKMTGPTIEDYFRLVEDTEVGYFESFERQATSAFLKIYIGDLNETPEFKQAGESNFHLAA